MFIDEARIFIKGGDGGSGAVSFRREKHVPRGGPDGGNGGRGASIIFEVDEGLKTLMDFKYQHQYKAQRGANGQGGLRNGASGNDLTLKLPPGTLIKDDNGKVLIDLKTKGQRFIAAEGGHGGKGNAYFATSTRKVPHFAQKGEPAKSSWLKLELKLLADVGIVGMPNAGKSTFISVVSAAKPKIADYPFTTLVPNLGVVGTDSYTYVIADIPGLIEGAHKGAGLGDTFLKHIDRAGLILHMIDLNRDDPINDFKIIDNELRLYSKDLAARQQVVVGNKIEVLENEKKINEASKYFEQKSIRFFAISAVTKKGIKPLLNFLGKKVHELEEKEPVEENEEVVTYTLDNQRLSYFEVAKEDDKTFAVKGRGIERLVSMTDLGNAEALEYLQKQFKAIKFEQRLRKAGAQEGDLIKIGTYEFNLSP